MTKFDLLQDRIENNFLSMLVNEGNVDDGILSMTLVTTTPG
jgi:hypothetical protein